MTAVAAACSNTSEQLPARPVGQTIRVAVVGGMIETGFWQELALRYQRLTGNTVELAASGPKPQVIAAFRKGGIDLITVHASDAMVHLVAEGLAKDPQPWLLNDLVIMGPVEDPAHIRGERDAAKAVQMIMASNSKLIIHASLGADGVLHDLKDAAKLTLDPALMVMFDGANQHRILERAAELKAYTMVGRIPVITGKLTAHGMEIMVRGDPRLRRPYLVEVAANAGPAAIDLAAFLRQPDTQAWIASYGRGKYDDHPLFFPIAASSETR
ncbi:MAG: substrate-binding domain-containing protein [Kofleriaceae bacterium]